MSALGAKHPLSDKVYTWCILTSSRHLVSLKMYFHIVRAVLFISVMSTRPIKCVHFGVQFIWAGLRCQSRKTPNTVQCRLSHCILHNCNRMVLDTVKTRWIRFLCLPRTRSHRKSLVPLPGLFPAGKDQAFELHDGCQVRPERYRLIYVRFIDAVPMCSPVDSLGPAPGNPC